MSKHYIKDIGEVNYIGCVDSVTMGTYDVSELETITKCYSEKFVKDLQQQITDLKSQLAEKDKEQNQKAIEQLEKVKGILIQNADEIGEEYKEDYFMISLGNVKNIIDQQINKLKGKVEDER